MVSAVPTLSVNGFVVNKKAIMVKLFEHFLCSDYSQSNTFRGKISSMKYIIMNSANDSEVRKELSASIDQLYSAYFEKVISNIEVVSAEEATTTKYTVDIVCYDELNVEYKLSNEIYESAGHITNFDNLITNLRELKYN